MTEINRLLSLRRIEQCLNDVRAWMGDNQLKVNDDKTVALVLSSRNNRANHNITVIKIGDCDITPSPTGRNIDVIFDTEMSMVSHVKHVCCISYYHLRNIASIRSCLTQKAAVRLVYSLVISRIDLPQCLICKLQRVQNAAARLVVRCHRCEHITLVLMKLHWLSVKQRVQYSILLLVFRAQHRLASPYITDLLEQRATRIFRSTTNNDLYVPPSRNRYGDRMFSVAGPRLWNSLPAEIKKTCCIVTFKGGVKRLNNHSPNIRTYNLQHLSP